MRSTLVFKMNLSGDQRRSTPTQIPTQIPFQPQPQPQPQFQIPLFTQPTRSINMFGNIVQRVNSSKGGCGSCGGAR